MKIALPALIAAVARAGVASTATADTMDGHTIVAPQEIKWGPAPAVLPPWSGGGGPVRRSEQGRLVCAPAQVAGGL